MWTATSSTCPRLPSKTKGPMGPTAKESSSPHLTQNPGSSIPKLTANSAPAGDNNFLRWTDQGPSMPYQIKEILCPASKHHKLSLRTTSFRQELPERNCWRRPSRLNCSDPSLPTRQWLMPLFWKNKRDSWIFHDFPLPSLLTGRHFSQNVEEM